MEIPEDEIINVEEIPDNQLTAIPTELNPTSDSVVSTKYLLRNSTNPETSTLSGFSLSANSAFSRIGKPDRHVSEKRGGQEGLPSEDEKPMCTSRLNADVGDNRRNCETLQHLFPLMHHWNTAQWTVAAANHMAAMFFDNLGGFSPLYNQLRLSQMESPQDHPQRALFRPPSYGMETEQSLGSLEHLTVLPKTTPSSLRPPPLKKYQCDECGKAFSRSNTLVTHKRIHSGEKPFKCDSCGRAFRQPGNLTRHKLTHTTVKPYICIICDKAFNRASNLHTHMRTHANNRSGHLCAVCGKVFMQSSELDVHVYTHAGFIPSQTLSILPQHNLIG